MILFSKLMICSMVFSGGTSKEYKNMEASFYHDKFQGRRTASSDIFCQSLLTGASNVYELGDSVEVCNEENECIDILINDRISTKYNHRIDLTKTGFKMLGNPRKGIIKVKTRIKK